MNEGNNVKHSTKKMRKYPEKMEIHWRGVREKLNREQRMREKENVIRIYFIIKSKFWLSRDALILKDA